MRTCPQIEKIFRRDRGDRRDNSDPIRVHVYFSLAEAQSTQRLFVMDKTFTDSMPFPNLIGDDFFSATYETRMH